MCFLGSFALRSGKVKSERASGLEKEWGDDKSTKETVTDTTDKASKDAISTAKTIVSIAEKASDKVERLIDNFFPSGFKQLAKGLVGTVNWGFEKREERRQKI